MRPCKPSGPKLKRYVETTMATLFMVCGLPGSGKTTLAKQIEREQSALRLAPDEWMARIIGDGYDEAKRATVEAVQWEIAARALSLGVNVVLESGFWSRRERDDLRSRAVALGADAKLRFLDVPRDELLRRLALRNAVQPADTFRVDDAQLDLWFGQFEPPTPDELE
jgi:predicted kinase